MFFHNIKKYLFFTKKIKGSKFNILLLFFLIVFSFIILIYRIDKNPPGFFIDESIYGYEAYSIIKNKGYSSNGEFLPRFFKNPTQETRGHSSYVYFISILVAIFGLKEFTVRLGSVISSLIILLMIFIFLKKKINVLHIFIILLWWPFTSWVFLLSRLGVEHIFGAMFYFVPVLILDNLLMKKNNKLINFFYLGILLLLIFYSCAGGKLLSFFYLICYLILIWFFLEKHFTRKLIYSFIIIFFFLLSLFLSLSYILDQSFFTEVMNYLLYVKIYHLFVFLKIFFLILTQILILKIHIYHQIFLFFVIAL